jgi:hypothetical protein
MDKDASHTQKSQTAQREEEVLRFWKDNDIGNGTQGHSIVANYDM